MRLLRMALNVNDTPLKDLNRGDRRMLVVGGLDLGTFVTTGEVAVFAASWWVADTFVSGGDLP